MKKHIDIKKLVTENPQNVIEHLLCSDTDYWEAVKSEIIYPFLDDAQAYGKRIQKKNVDRADVYSHIYEKMTMEKKLEDLREPKYVLSFIIQYVRAYVLSLYKSRKKETILVSVEKFDNNDGETEINYIGLDEEPSKSKKIQILHESFNKLWEKQPKRALVLLLRYVNGLSAKEVQRFMDFASENYVNQVVNLAKGDLKEIYVSIEEALDIEE